MKLKEAKKIIDEYLDKIELEIQLTDYTQYGEFISYVHNKGYTFRVNFHGGLLSYSPSIGHGMIIETLSDSLLIKATNTKYYNRPYENIKSVHVAKLTRKQVKDRNTTISGKIK